YATVWSAPDRQSPENLAPARRRLPRDNGVGRSTQVRSCFGHRVNPKPPAGHDPARWANGLGPRVNRVVQMAAAAQTKSDDALRRQLGNARRAPAAVNNLSVLARRH